MILLGCVKLKGSDPAPARSLYRSPLWSKRRTYAEASSTPWLILSAKHGLLDPDETVAPYDLALADLTAAQRRAWGVTVVEQLQARLGGLQGTLLEIHAGSSYRDAISDGVERAGGRIDAPLRGLFMGQQLAWYSISR